jgi:hypothetical protein
VVILSPKRSGKFTIPGANAVINGKKFQSDAVHVSVQRTGLTSAGSTNNNEDVDIESASELQPHEKAEDEIKRNFFLRAEINKKTCYVGEPLMAVYKCYSRLNTNAQVVKRPSLNGFSVIEMVDAYDNRQEIEVLNGIPYYVNIIRKVQLIPLQDGEFILDPAEVEGVVHFNKREGQTMNWNAVDYPVNVTSPPVNIVVKPLPADKQPDHFSGAVGQFTIDVLTPHTVIRQGDLVNIQLVISGSGNLTLITAPSVIWPRGVDTADPAVKENVNKYVYPLAGHKSFEYSFAAPDTGNCVIPVINLSYFDPTDNTYKTASTQPVTLHIAPGVSKAEMDERNASIEKKNETGIPRHLYFFGGVVLIIAGLIFYQSWQLKKAREKKLLAAREEAAQVPLVPAPREINPEELLYEAREALQQSDKVVFYQEVQRVLWNVVAEKCEIPPSSLNKQQVAGRLADKGVPNESILNLTSILHDCELALYSPGQQQDDMKRIFYQARTFLQDLNPV